MIKANCVKSKNRNNKTLNSTNYNWVREGMRNRVAACECEGIMANLFLKSVTVFYRNYPYPQIKVLSY